VPPVAAGEIEHASPRRDQMCEAENPW
jgi:hypothetical protein